MLKCITAAIYLCMTLHAFSQTATPASGKNMAKLVGRWKAVLLCMSDDHDSSNTIRINLTDPPSIKYFSDTVFYGGLFGKLKAEPDTSLATRKTIQQASLLFKDMDRTFVSFRSDSTYALNNQRTLFGFAADGTVFKSLEGRKYFVRDDRLGRKQKTLLLNVAKGDDRGFLIIKLSGDALIIDEEWRDPEGPPVKEITFKRQ